MPKTRLSRKSYGIEQPTHSRWNDNHYKNEKLPDLTFKNEVVYPIDPFDDSLETDKPVEDKDHTRPWKQARPKTPTSVAEMQGQLIQGKEYEEYLNEECIEVNDQYLRNTCSHILENEKDARPDRLYRTKSRYKRNPNIKRSSKSRSNSRSSAERLDERKRDRSRRNSSTERLDDRNHNRSRKNSYNNELSAEECNTKTTHEKAIKKKRKKPIREFNSDSSEFSDFKLPRGYMNKVPLPPKSPTFSFRSTIGLIPSSKDGHGLRQLVISSLSCSLAPLACGFAMAYVISKNSQQALGFQYGLWRIYVFMFGCIAGAFFSSVLINLARKMALLLSVVVLAISWLLTIFATMNWMIIVHQIISGMCTGIIMSISQVYISEISTPRHRGAVSSMPIISFQIGMLLCFFLGEIMEWKFLAIIGICLTTPFLFCSMLCMPESPRYLIFVRPNDALATLQWIRGIESEVMEEYRDIADNYMYDRWKMECFELALPSFWRPLLITNGLMFFYSMTGVSSFTLYGNELFNTVQTFYQNSSRFVVTSIMIIGMTISSLLMDQIGRKLVLLLSLTIMSATAFTLGLFLFLKDYNKVESFFMYQWAAEIFCVVLFTFAHGSGLGPIAWVTLGEIFGPKYKWLGVSSASMMFWSSLLVSDVVYQKIRIIVETGGVFWFHCVICVVAYIFILLLFKELKDQSIDEVTKSFSKRHDRLVDTFISRIRV